VGVRIDTASASGIAETVLLKKIGAEWRMSLRHVEKEATSGEWIGNRCEAADAPDHAPSESELGKLTGDYSVVRVGASRQFRGHTDSVGIRLGALRPSSRKGIEMIATVDMLDETGKPEKKIAGTLEVSRNFAVITFIERLPEGVIQFDGWIEQYRILGANSREFFGRWETSSGPTVPFTGYFCARSTAAR
jgi:hypothetical protein